MDGASGMIHYDTDMLLEVRAVEPFFKNGFLLGCEATREAVLIDPGDEVDDLLAIVRRKSLAVRHVLLTHAHVDHVSGVARAHAALGAPVTLHRDDLFLYESAVDQGRLFGLSIDRLPAVNRFYGDAPEVTFGGYFVRAHHTPGHSPGSVCLQVGQTGRDGRSLFVGDTLFAGSIGRTDLPGGNYKTLIRSIKDVLFAFGDAADVYPGHGPQTTIGEERRTNPFLTA
jgi:glyoxylase-like metal-dependent hydrolase (beta-lactamase superfamily II)